jgi:hypothetical protein
LIEEKSDAEGAISFIDCLRAFETSEIVAILGFAAD